jgi:hypothetical protein
VRLRTLFENKTDVFDREDGEQFNPYPSNVENIVSS